MINVRYHTSKAEFLRKFMRDTKAILFDVEGTLMKHKDEVSKYLYPIPFLEEVRFLFDELKKAKGREILGIIFSNIH